MSVVELLREANRQEQKGQWDEAIATYNQAIENNPKFHWSHYYLGQALTRIGQFGKAVKYYQKAIQINPDSFCAYHSLGQVLYRLAQDSPDELQQYYPLVASYLQNKPLIEVQVLEDHIFLKATDSLSNEDFLKEAYHTYLRREPDQDGLSNYFQLMNSGNMAEEREKICLSFHQSDECKAASQSMDQEALKLAKVLQLDDEAFLEKTRYLDSKKFLQEAYRTYLMREIDLESLEKYQPKINLDKIRIDFIHQTIRESDEFQKLITLAFLKAAIAVLGTAIELCPNTKQLYYTLGKALEASGENYSAFSCYSKVPTES